MKKHPSVSISSPTYKILHELLSAGGMENLQVIFSRHFNESKKPITPVKETDIRAHIWRCVDSVKVNDVDFEISFPNSKGKVLEMKGTNSTGKTTAALTISALLGLDLRPLREKFLKPANIDRIDELFESGFCTFDLTLDESGIGLYRGSDGKCKKAEEICYILPGKTKTESMDLPVGKKLVSLNDSDRRERRALLSDRLRQLWLPYLDVDYIDSERDIATNISTLLMETMQEDLRQAKDLIEGLRNDAEETSSNLKSIEDKYSSVDSYLDRIEGLKGQIDELETEVKAKEEELQEEMKRVEERRELIKDIAKGLGNEGLTKTESQRIATRLARWGTIKEVVSSLQYEVEERISSLKDVFVEFGETGSKNARKDVMQIYDKLKAEAKSFLEGLKSALQYKGKDIDRLDMLAPSWKKFLSDYEGQLAQASLEHIESPEKLWLELESRNEADEAAVKATSDSLDDIKDEMREIGNEIERLEKERKRLVGIMEKEGFPYADQKKRDEIQQKHEEWIDKKEVLERFYRVIEGLGKTVEVIPYLHEERFWQYFDSEDFFTMKMNSQRTSVRLKDYLNSLDTELFPRYMVVINHMAQEFIPQIPILSEKKEVEVAEVSSVDIFYEKITYKVDSKETSIDFHDLGKGQKSVITILSTAKKPCSSKYGRILFVDEIGDIDRSPTGFYFPLVRMLSKIETVLCVFFIFPSPEKEVIVSKLIEESL